MCHAARRHAKQRGLADGGVPLPDGAMRVACPACGTEYEAPDEAAGRMLRCAACGAVFRAGGGAPPQHAGPVPTEPPPSDPHSAPRDEPAASRRVAAAAPDRTEALAAAPASVPGPSAGPRIAWGLSVALLVVAGVALHAFRAEIAAAWPPMLRLYRALGLL